MLYILMTKIQSRKAVAPVIATLLLVAIAVVGGSIVLIFSQGFFSSAQVSSIPQIDSLSIIGYDAADNEHRQLHNGLLTDNQALPSITDGEVDNTLSIGERVAIYVTNKGGGEVTIDQIRFAGAVYSYTTMEVLESYDADAQIQNQEYTIIDKVEDGQIAQVSQFVIPTIPPGQTVSLLLELEQNVKIGRDLQIKITTAGGADFLGTVKAGQQRG